MWAGQCRGHPAEHLRQRLSEARQEERAVGEDASWDHIVKTTKSLAGITLNSIA